MEAGIRITSSSVCRLKQCCSWGFWVFGMRLLFPVLVLGRSSSVTASVRPNVVAEVPGLDVGPLVSVTVARGDTARLPCRHPSYSEDTVSLVLWYLNHTSRPFLSYDARDKTDLEDVVIGRGRRSPAMTFEGRGHRRRRRKRSNGKEEEQVTPKEKDIEHEDGGQRFSNRSRDRQAALAGGGEEEEGEEAGGEGNRTFRGDPSRDRRGRRRRKSSRMSLEGGGGTSLVIREVSQKDQAEYRCRVHFRLSPTWTQRLLLTVPDSVYDVELTDATGLPLEGPGVGPLAEGDTLNLACQANHGEAEVLSLDWLLEGVEVDTTWASAEKGVVINQLTISGLEQRHRNARLTCRLTTSDPAHSYITANITDASTIITMFYLPESKLLVEGGRRSGEGGGGREVVEGKSINFFCSVRADPPAYNITWLHNGRVVQLGGRRWRRDNTSLVITPVNREDSGLYTCLASNSEGDGHSNAVHLKVAHTPYCSGIPSQQLVVAANTTITLSCQMEAVPKDIVFTWMQAAPPLMPIPKVGADPQEAIITGVGHVPHLSNVIDLVPGQPETDPDYWISHTSRPREVPPLPPSWQEMGKVVPPLPPPSLEEGDGDDPIPDGLRLSHRLDPTSPAKSHVTITPTASAQVICYARNRVGRTRVPCTYSLTVVEPPGPLQGCNITGIGETKLEVKCDTHAHIRSSHASEDAAHIHHSPSLGFVRSPEASARANLEVWSGGTLLANVSNPRPEFIVRGLPPAAPLQLILYSATAHTKSTPVYKYARTLPRATVHLTVPPLPTESKPLDPTKKAPIDSGEMGGLGMAIAGLVGGVGMSLFILVAVIMVMRRRQQRRLAEEEIVSEHLSVAESKEILSLTIPVIPSPSQVTHIALASHTPPPPKMLARSSERLCRGSKESFRSSEEIYFRRDRPSCSSEGFPVGGKVSPRVK